VRSSLHRSTLEETLHRSTLGARHTADGSQRPTMSSTMRSTGGGGGRETRDSALRATLPGADVLLPASESPRPTWRNLASPFTGFRARRDDTM
jgi:hypothetical protein